MPMSNVIVSTVSALNQNFPTPQIINSRNMPIHNQAAPQDDEASINSSIASLDTDLQALNEMDIDADFNLWSSFRGSFSVQKRASLESIGSRKRSSGASTSAVLMGQKNHDKFEDSLVSIAEVDVPEDPFKQLSPAEQKDIQQWNARLAREQVFSRYYFPEHWELREMSTIQKFLKLENPNSSPGFMVRNCCAVQTMCKLSYL